jgi:protein tyrosine/serine phosphatase
MKIAKQQRRQFRRGMTQFRAAVAEASPLWARRTFGPLIDYADMLLVDHGIFRLLYPNRHRIADGVWRSSQPTPGDVRRLARKGIRTIVNLRGERDCGAYRLEVESCRAAGIRLVNFQVKSRAAPLPETIRAAESLFEEIEYPMLMHCKSGADRVGLMSTLFLLLKERRPLEEAKGQLNWRFGHFRSADTGILDHFFDRYEAEGARQGVPFFDWIALHYDPDELKRSFRASGWTSFLVNRVLRRE